MDDERKEWDRLECESEGAHMAFRAFLSLPPGERTIVAAYRINKNSSALKASDSWYQWSRSFRWHERARAHDNHFEMLRRRGAERAVEKEAEREGALAERMRAETFEMLDRTYKKAVKFLEEDLASREMTWNHINRIIGLHLNAAQAFGMDQESKDESTWTETDDREFLAVLEKIEAERDPEDVAKGSSEEDSKLDHPEEGSENIG